MLLCTSPMSPLLMAPSLDLGFSLSVESPDLPDLPSGLLPSNKQLEAGAPTDTGDLKTLSCSDHIRHSGCPSCSSSLLNALWCELAPKDRRLTSQLKGQLAWANWILLRRRAQGLFSVRRLKCELAASRLAASSAAAYQRATVRSVSLLLCVWHMRAVFEHNKAATIQASELLGESVWGPSQQHLDCYVLNARWQGCTRKLMNKQQKVAHGGVWLPGMRLMAQQWHKASAQCRAVSQKYGSVRVLPVPVFYSSHRQRSQEPLTIGVPLLQPQA